MQQGTILEVNTAPAGDELADNAALGATTLTLVGVSDFDAAGGQVEIGGYIYTYSAVNATTLQMTLTAGLVGALDAGERVNVYPTVTEKWAMVEALVDDDVILALVPHGLWDRLDDGVRDPGEQESIILEQQNGDWAVADVIGAKPLVSGEYIDPETAVTNPLVNDALSDLAAQIIAHDSQISDNTTSIENVSETAYSAIELAATADGRISISDYLPAPADAAGRNEGSIWLTRTRARRNFITNPSFEVDTAHWAGTQTTLLRELSSVVISGSYSLKLTNSATVGTHIAEWNRGATRQEVIPGEVYTASVYAAAVSGTNTGVFARMVFYNASSAVVGTFDGTGVTLLVDDYQRLYVTATAPTTAATVLMQVVNPSGSENAVWRIDGALLENSGAVGRYFDGRSYDGSWTDTVDLSASVLVGGRIVNVFELRNGGWFEKWFTGTTLLDIDASKIVSGTLDGERLGDYSVPQDKMSATPIQASEALAAGDLVNIYSLGGAFRIRKASAAAATPYPAHGYVLTAVATDGIGFVYSHGYNPFVTALQPGLQFLSTTAGKATNISPTAAGTVSQRVGFAGGATVLNFVPNPPIFLF